MFQNISIKCCLSPKIFSQMFMISLSVCDEDGWFMGRLFWTEIPPFSLNNRWVLYVAEFLSGCSLKHVLGFWGHFSLFHTELAVTHFMWQSEWRLACRNMFYTHWCNVATFFQRRQIHWRLSSKTMVCCRYCMLLMYSKIGRGLLWSCLRTVWWPDNMCS
jgi:hypothetical protein